MKLTLTHSYIFLALACSTVARPEIDQEECFRKRDLRIKRTIAMSRFKRDCSLGDCIADLGLSVSACAMAVGEEGLNPQADADCIIEAGELVEHVATCVNCIGLPPPELNTDIINLVDNGGIDGGGSDGGFDGGFGGGDDGGDVGGGFGGGC